MDKHRKVLFTCEREHPGLEGWLPLSEGAGEKNGLTSPRQRGNEAAIPLAGACNRNASNCHLVPFALRQDRQGAAAVLTWSLFDGLHGRWSRCCLTGQAHVICWYYRKCLSVRGTACSSSTVTAPMLFCSAILHPIL